jgi:hypothetical protein
MDTGFRFPCLLNRLHRVSYSHKYLYLIEPHPSRAAAFGYQAECMVPAMVWLAPTTRNQLIPATSGSSALPGLIRCCR